LASTDPTAPQTVQKSAEMRAESVESWSNMQRLMKAELPIP